MYRVREAALTYAKKGWPVLPLHSIRNRRCTCGRQDCGSPGKHPVGRLVPHWRTGATTDAKTIRRGWRQCPWANIGIVTGEASGLVVVDVDPRNGGAATLRALERKHGRMRETLQAATGGGGRHFFFANLGGTVKGRPRALGKGVDVKADGGYVVAPPSLHQSGKRYAWAGGRNPARVELAVLPSWIGHALGDGCQTMASPTKDGTRPIPQGERNDTLMSLAGKMRRAGMDRHAILAALSEENTRRCGPPLGQKEVERIAESVAGYPAGPPAQDNVATRLVRLAREVRFFHNPAGDAYAVLPVRGHSECWPIGSKPFRRWLLERFYRKFRKAPGSQAVQDAVELLACRAQFGGVELPVHVRVAKRKKAIYLDLADEKWRVVEIMRKGWRVLTKSPVRFTRPRGMLPLPRPVRGGAVSALRQFVNLPDDDYVLVAAWLVAALRPQGPYPLLAVNGEQGSGKSTLCRVLRSLVDPNVAPLRSAPRDERDLMIAATNAWVLAFDNISKIPHPLSDALCRLSTGGGFATRELYTDDGERLFDATRPILINGIEDLANRADLLDRSICVTLPTIRDANRKPESEFWRDFERARGAILGALLDAVSAALQNLPRVNLTRPPRMADFAVWAVAAERGLGLSEGAFLRAYKARRADGTFDAIEMSAVGPAIQKLMRDKHQWQGTAQALLTTISCGRYADEHTTKRPDWPQMPRGMAGALRRLAPYLRQAGIEVNFVGKQGKARQRVITLQEVENPAPARPAIARRRRLQGPVAGGAGDAGGGAPASSSTPHVGAVAGRPKGIGPVRVKVRVRRR